MADAWSVISIKEFPYRDETEEWSNRYHFNGGEPTTDAEFQTFVAALWNEEKKIFSSETSIVRAYGYHDDAGHALFTRDLTLNLPARPVGSLVAGGSGLAPGDAAGTLRWETGAFNERGRKIYLRKYWHGVYQDGTDPDKVMASQLAAYGAFAGFLTSGTLPGGAVLAGPRGVTAGAHLANPFITTRTLKRRGKRPTPSQ